MTVPSLAAAPIAAPLWRRLLAAVYDGLLLLGLWMVAALADVLATDLAGVPRANAALRAILLVVGLGFFGWFWTHGGQTLGMRVWRLRVLRDSGAPLGWNGAAARYAGLLAVWAVVLAPPAAALPHLRDEPHAGAVALACTALAALMLIAMRLDGARRAPQDWLSGSRVVLVDKAAPAMWPG